MLLDLVAHVRMFPGPLALSGLEIGALEMSGCFSRFQGLLTNICGIFLENKEVWIVPPEMPSSLPGVCKRGQHMGVL